jgi:glutathione S-transferase
MRAMKLYFFPGACSLAPHIALREADLPFTMVRYDQKTHQVEGVGPIEEVNEKGKVPVLELDDGQRLTEVSAILQYIADRKPELELAPRCGTFERYRLAEWLNFIATEVHKSYFWLFHDGADVEKAHAKEKLDEAYAYVQRKLEGKSFLMGDTFTVADAYLVVVLNWMKPAGLDAEKFPGLKAYRDRIRARPAVMAAMEAEGLIRRRA